MVPEPIHHEENHLGSAGRYHDWQTARLQHLQTESAEILHKPTERPTMKVNCEAGTRVNLSRTLSVYDHQATLPRAQSLKQLEKKAGQVKSADFCVQDAGANQNSVLSWRRSAPGSRGSARVSIHVHATKPAASQPQWPACFAQDLGAVGCRGRFHFPRLPCFMAFVGHHSFLLVI